MLIKYYACYLCYILCVYYTYVVKFMLYILHGIKLFQFVILNRHFFLQTNAAWSSTGNISYYVSIGVKNCCLNFAYVV